MGDMGLYSMRHATGNVHNSTIQKKAGTSGYLESQALVAEDVARLILIKARTILGRNMQLSLVNWS